MQTMRTQAGERKAVQRWLTISPWKVYVLLTLMLISTVGTVRAGDLKNTGTINNSGQVRVKNQASGLPASNGGLYEFFGGNQTVPGRQYVDLKLSGTGTKTADADATVSGGLTVGPGITYSTGAFTTHLTGTLIEQGYVQGKLEKTENLSAGFGTSTFGDIGASITWSGIAPGATTVVRASGMAITAAATAQSSIKRYYDITPSTNANLDATLVFKYADAELNGQAVATLSLWKSTDGGATWRNQGGSVDAVQRTITKSAITSFGTWTAADAAHPLGLTVIEGAATNLSISMGNGQTGLVNTLLPMQMVVTVTDAYGNPVTNTPLTFVISSAPIGAAGQRLSNANSVTDNLGQASTSLTLGDKPGVYQVSASSPSVSGIDILFDATAVNPAPASIATTMTLISGNNQTGVAYTNLSQPYVLTIADQFGAPMAGLPVKFALTSSPVGTAGHKLTDTIVTTNTDGQAQTTFRLGTKAGPYVVTATHGSISGSPVVYTSYAVAGAAANVILPLGTTYAGQVSLPVSPALITLVTDLYGNPVRGADVRYVLTSGPSGAAGTSPEDATVATDSLGRSQTTIVIGSKPGEYIFRVSVGSLPPQTVTVTATGGQAGFVASRLVLTSGNGQSAVVGSQLTNPFVVTVLDTSLNPVAGIGVRFDLGVSPVASTGRSLIDTLVATDSNGQARTYLKLGSRAGQYTVIASSGQLTGSPVTFSATATAGDAARLLALSGDRQSSPVSTHLLLPFVIQVTDSQLNPISGVTVNFSITSAPANATGQTLDASQKITDSQGMASATLTLGDRAGDYRVEATSSAIAGGIAAFTGTATSPVTTARTLLLSSGQDQRGAVRSVLPQPIIVRTVDSNGNAVAGVTVQFAVDTIPSGASGHNLSSVTAASDLAGFASTLLTLGDFTGVYTVRATSPGLSGSPALIRATATMLSGAYTMSYASGDRQSSGVLTQVPAPFVVSVIGVDGTPVAGQAVTFAIDSLPSGSNGHSLNQSIATSDAQGRAVTTMTLGDKIGSYRVSAFVQGLGGSPVLFRVSSTVGLPKTITVVQGDGQTKPIATTLDNAFMVRIADVAGNPVPGVAVQFVLDSIPSASTGHNLRVINSVTDLQGQSQALLTLGSKLGRYVVSASSVGLDGSPAWFSSTATIGAAAVVSVHSGNGQTAQALTELPLPFVVNVTDAGGNLVPGIPVTFAVETIPTGARGQGIRLVNSVTDLSGQASAYLTLGDRDGGYAVTAGFAGTARVQFTAIATVLVGDVNSNTIVDIADLTTVIDHILGKIILTGSDSVKADFNRDGHIDIRDVVAMQNSLLAINGVSGKSVAATIPPGAGNCSMQSVQADSSASIGGEFILTENGLRFNMTNAEPVKGLQLTIRFKDVQNILRPDVIFERARVDSFYLSVTGHELRIVAYNLGNIPISAGAGTLFRLPLRLTDVNAIESAQIIASRTNNTMPFDEALASSALVRLVKSQDLPSAFVLYQNYPNPFNGQTNVSYEVLDIAGMAEVSIQVFNLLGEKVRTLETGRHAGGRFTVRWDGTDDHGTKLSSGAYYFRLISGSFVSSKKMLMLK